MKVSSINYLDPYYLLLIIILKQAPYLVPVFSDHRSTENECKKSSSTYQRRLGLILF